MVNRQAKNNDTESSKNGNLSMGGSMLKQKISKLGYVTFYVAPSARSGCFGKGATGPLLERDIPAWCECALVTACGKP